MKIIVAEYDPVSRERLRDALFILGHEVRAFANGREALEAHLVCPASVIISDWSMPELDGMAFHQAVRQAACQEGANASYTYFILIASLHGDLAECDRATQMGVDDFLVKPFEVGAIWRRLNVAQRVLKDAAEMKQLRANGEGR